MIQNKTIKNILVTGGSGFIGSHFLSLACPRFPNIEFMNVDMLDYSTSLKTQEHLDAHHNYKFINIDITDAGRIDSLFQENKFDLVVHFAAQSHVDNSISSPWEFINTNIIGTYNILQGILSSNNDTLFHHISTDEIYGSLNFDEPSFTEFSKIDPSSPYSASKASSDLLVQSWGRTYGMKYLITNCSNNFGPRQYYEKLIPKVIFNRVSNKKIPIYGTGENIRDWLFVEDHIESIFAIYHQGLFCNERFNIGGGTEISNLDLVKSILKIMDSEFNFLNSFDYLDFVQDRKGHDLRYSIDDTKLKKYTDSISKSPFDQSLKFTIGWYLENLSWWDA